MKTYQIQNRYTKEFETIEADSAQDACKKVGWMIGDCWIKEIKESK